MKFKVLRQHQGDKFYQPGDFREATEADVKHLIGTVLAKDEGPAPSNKAEAAAPKNKGQGKGKQPAAQETGSTG